MTDEDRREMAQALMLELDYNRHKFTRDQLMTALLAFAATIAAEEREKVSSVLKDYGAALPEWIEHGGKRSTLTLEGSLIFALDAIIGKYVAETQARCAKVCREITDSYAGSESVKLLCAEAIEKLSPISAADVPPVVCLPTFEEVWAIYKKRGYQYGYDALENVKFGWEIHRKAMLAAAQRDGEG